MDAKLEKQQEAAEEAVYAHKVRKMHKAQRNRQLARDHLKSTAPQTQAAEAADAHRHHNYMQPEPVPPPSDEEVEMVSSSNPPPPPPPGGSPIAMPIIDPAPTSRRRVRRKKTIAGNAASIRHTEIIKPSKVSK